MRLLSVLALGKFRNGAFASPRTGLTWKRPSTTHSTWENRHVEWSAREQPLGRLSTWHPCYWSCEESRHAQNANSRDVTSGLFVLHLRLHDRLHSAFPRKKSK